MPNDYEILTLPGQSGRSPRLDRLAEYGTYRQTFSALFGGFVAGDWIKIEHATLDKPEIAIAAEVLGISHAESLSLFLRYWVWLDQNLDEARHGFVRFVSRKSLEQTVRCDGFAGILEQIGWAVFDDEQQLLGITNWERHNGKSAKSRAIDQKRKAKERHASVQILSDVSWTREEKRRDIKPLTTVATVATLPDWLPVETWKDYRQHRSAMKAPLTAKAAELALRKLSALRVAGGDPVLIVEQSIERGWRSFFPIDGGKLGSSAEWWASEGGTTEKASALGLKLKAGESWAELRARIRQKEAA